METTFTASEIADALGVKRGSVYDRLKNSPASGVKIVEGKPTQTWNIYALPNSLRSDLEAMAQKKGYRDASAMLARPEKAWQPPIPLAELSPDCIEKAAKLRAALARMIENRNSPLVTAEELRQMGCDDYRREFGHSVSSRYIYDLFTRALRRDGNAGQFERLEIYLDERLTRAKTEAAKATSEDMATLRAVVNNTGVDEKTVWLYALDYYSEQVEAGAHPLRTRRALLDFLFATVKLSRTRKGLDKAFKRNLQWYQKEDVSGLDDLRKQSKKENRAGMSEEGWRIALYLASVNENIELAWRSWKESTCVPAEDKALFFDSYRVPQRWRDAVKYDAKIVAEEIRGPRNAKLNGAHITRDPDAIASGDSDQSDDLTLPIVWYDELENGEIFCGQGQLLAWIDERSWMIYNLDLISDGAYTGFSVRNSWTNKAEAWGLPRKCIYVENGIWRDAKVFVGSKDTVGIGETEAGLRRLGIKFRHAQLPRGKIIERVFGSLQDLLHRLPGYCGRNQMMDRFETIYRQQQLVKSGQEHPSKFFLHKRQLMEILLEACEKINNSPKFGNYHQGLTPKQVYEKCFTDQLVKIPNETRHLLASNKIETVVGRNGITFRFGKRSFNYKSERTGQLRGHTVTAWFNPENPELLAVTKLDGSDPFVVRRSTLVPGHDAPSEILARAVAENREQNRYGKELMRSLKPMFKADFMARMFRPVIVDVQTLETAQEIQRQGEEMQASEKENRSLLTMARDAYGKLGLRVPETVNAESIEATRKLEQMLKDIE